MAIVGMNDALADLYRCSRCAFRRNHGRCVVRALRDRRKCFVPKEALVVYEEERVEV